MDYKYKHGGPFVEWKLLYQNTEMISSTSYLALKQKL